MEATSDIISLVSGLSSRFLTNRQSVSNPKGDETILTAGGEEATRALQAFAFLFSHPLVSESVYSHFAAKMERKFLPIRDPRTDTLIPASFLRLPPFDSTDINIIASIPTRRIPLEKFCSTLIEAIEEVSGSDAVLVPRSSSMVRSTELAHA